MAFDDGAPSALEPSLLDLGVAALRGAPAAVFIGDAPSGRIACVARVGFDAAAVDALVVDASRAPSITGDVVRSGERRFLADPSSIAAWPKSEGRRLGVLLEPVTHAGRVLGLLAVRLPEEELEALAGTAATLGRAIGTALKGDQSPRRTRPTDGSELGALVSAAVDGIIIIDEKGTIELFSASAQRIFGFSEAEVLGRNVSELMPEPDRSRHDSYLRNYERTGEAKIIGIGREVVARRKDGSLFSADLSVGAIEDRSQRRRYVGIVRDITERRAMSDRLRQQEEELRTTFENAPQGVLTCDAEGRVTRVNRAFCETLRAPASALVGALLPDLLGVADRSAWTAAFEDLLAGTSRSLHIPGRFKRRDGEALSGVLRCGVIRGERGEAKLAVVHLEDRTELQRAEAEATQQRERLAHVARISTMGEMASAIAHEVNQPLTAIAIYAQASKRMIETDMIDDAELLDTLGQISHEAQRAGGIIHHLRTLVRKRDSKRAACDLDTVVRDAMRLAEVDARLRNITLRLELGAGSRVFADEIQIQQVVLNLVRNAIEATPDPSPEGATVRVLSERLGPEVRVSVADQGIGVSGEASESLFKQFFTTKNMGMGLGLSISRTIVESHGGRMGFAANPDRGTTFWFTLPVCGAMGDDRD